MAAKKDNETFRKRKARRKMAWIAMYSMLFVTLAILFYVPDSKIDHLDSLLTWFFSCMTAVVLGYCGFATLDDNIMWFGKHKSKPTTDTAKKKEDSDDDSVVDDPDKEE
jgi:hypothetical protein